jgi:hypothetical protein
MLQIGRDCTRLAFILQLRYFINMTLKNWKPLAESKLQTEQVPKEEVKQPEPPPVEKPPVEVKPFGKETGKVQPKEVRERKKTL